MGKKQASTGVVLNKRIAKKLVKVLDAGLSAGLGEPTPGQMCVEAAISYACGLKFDDRPSCVHPTVREISITLNDAFGWGTNEERAKGMRRLAVAQLGSKSLTGKRGKALLESYNTRLTVNGSICLFQSILDNLSVLLVGDEPAIVEYGRQTRAAILAVLRDLADSFANSEDLLTPAGQTAAALYLENPDATLLDVQKLQLERYLKSSRSFGLRSEVFDLLTHIAYRLERPAILAVTRSLRVVADWSCSSLEDSSKVDCFLALKLKVLLQAWSRHNIDWRNVEYLSYSKISNLVGPWSRLILRNAAEWLVESLQQAESPGCQWLDLVPVDTKGKRR